MNSRLSLTLSALLLALGIVILWWMTSHRTAQEPAKLASPATSEPIPAAPVAAVEGEQDRAPVQETASPTAGKLPADDLARVHARFLDRAGSPIEQVLLSYSFGVEQEIGRSDAQGKVQGSVRSVTAKGLRLRIEAHHAEFVEREFERVLHPGELLDLGDVTLERGGAVSGRVVDERGRAVARARIYVAPADNHSGPARMASDGPYNVTNMGQSDERGQFRFAGVPKGDTRVWACRENPPWSCTEPFPVRDGEETRDLEIALRDASPEGPLSLRFLVLTPQGEPVAGARLVYRARREDGMSLGAIHSDAKGAAKFDEKFLQQMTGGTIDVDVSDPAGKWGGVALAEVSIAAGDHELRLSSPHRHQLIVQTADGNGVEDFTWRMLDLARFTRPDWTRTCAQPVRGLRSLDYFNGSVLVGAGQDLPSDRPPSQPQSFSGLSIGSGSDVLRDPHPGPPKPLIFASGELPFVLQVNAPGFERAEVGPFAPATATESITITLEPLPEIRGTVVHAKQPLASADVRLLLATRSAVNGFPSRVDPQALARTKTDAEGRFRLPFREAGTYVVQAQASEFGIGEYGPADFALTGAPSEVLVEIADPGRIEGQLLLPKEAADEEWIVGASRGDGKALSCRAAHDGTFRFEKLSPGRWMLHGLEREIVEGEMSWGAGPEPSPSDRPWPYEVRSGETTRVEIDLRQTAELTGLLAIPGWEGCSWEASLEPSGALFGTRRRASGVLDGSTFQMEVRPPGTYRLMIFVQQKEGRASRSEIDQLALVAGAQSWSFPKATGTVVVVNRRDAGNSFELRNDLGPERSSTLYFFMQARTELTLTGVFAGSSHLTRIEDMRPSDVGTLEVQPGATIRFDRP